MDTLSNCSLIINFLVLVLFVRDPETNKLKEFKFPAEEDFKADNLKKWIRRNSGIYLPLPGCLEEFDLLADKLMESSRYHFHQHFMRSYLCTKVFHQTFFAKRKVADARKICCSISPTIKIKISRRTFRSI